MKCAKCPPEDPTKQTFIYIHSLSLIIIVIKIVYIDPSLLNTTSTVFSRILISSPIFQLLMYSLSSRTTSSKSVISLRPLTCHMPVMPGLIASRTLWCNS